MAIQEAARVFTDPKAYADEKRFHTTCARLRRESPVTRIEVEGFDPFWAITKHPDVMEIERQPERWINAPRPALARKPRNGAADVPVRTLVQMDPPDHTVYRRISSDWFKPKSIARLNERATVATRGRVMSDYASTNYLALTLGQLLVNVTGPGPLAFQL